MNHLKLGLKNLLLECLDTLVGYLWLVHVSRKPKSFKHPNFKTHSCTMIMSRNV